MSADISKSLPQSAMRAYQSEAVTFQFERDASLMLLQMGAGKTVITATTITELLSERVLARVLVVCPLRVAHLVWPDEFSKWEHLRGWDTRVAVGTPKQRTAAMSGFARIVIINQENFVWATQQPAFASFDGLVLDDVQLTDTKTKRFKAMRRVRRQFKWMTKLDGTPTEKSAADLYAPMAVLDGGERLGRTQSAFRDAFMQYDGPNHWNWSLREGATEEIMDRVAPVAYQVPDHVYRDQLPELVSNTVDVVLDMRSQSIYRMLERESVAELEGGASAMAVNDGVLVNKLQQVAQGFLYGDDGAVVLGDAKLEALGEVIASARGPLIVVYKYIEDLNRLMAHYPGVVLGGRRTATETVVRRWNDGHVPLMYLHPASAGHGLNLQAGGNEICFYGLEWSRRRHDQTVARLWRKGQPRTVWVHYIIARGTVDEDVMRAIASKQNVGQAIAEGIRARSS